MKIKKLAVADTAFLHLKDPDGSFLYDGGEKVGIDLYSPGSAQHAVVEERATGRIVKRRNESEGKLELAPLDQRRAETAEDLADVTAAFRHIEYDGPDGAALVGAPLYVAVYSDPSLGWIKEQVVKFQADWGKFKPGSATA